jgi:hypothetical protein
LERKAAQSMTARGDANSLFWGSMEEYREELSDIQAIAIVPIVT